MIRDAECGLRQARDEIDAALDMLGGGRVADASPRMAEAVCRVTEAMQELAWTWSDRAAYGEGVEDGRDERD